jgi:hypothetical protein
MRTERTAGAFSMSAAGTAFAGTTLKTYTKFCAHGVMVKLTSGGSVGETIPKTLGVARIGAAGTASIFQKFTCTLQAGGSALGQVFDLSLSSPATVASYGESIVVIGSSATIADHGCVVGEVIWRYKILPFIDEY